ncbi:hypothetical protein [Gaoshiqia sediminis]|uniref:Uncharacterized protein n=1 Tax=Gaoshiqia sediminis TaxID=2986998 RepID=A0AA41YB99_9BACT|nr:hypothetical protein [Gaoshiqia sediminis]MCW0482815.1 hypothetical protein [Gaoshiqia sediminis]
MKTKKFTFQQTVVNQVQTTYSYKIKAKTTEEAESKFKKMFEEKLEEGKGHLPLKKLKPKKEKVETSPVSPEMTDTATIVVSVISKNKKQSETRPVYDNKSQLWATAAGGQQDVATVETEDISREIPITDAEEVSDETVEAHAETTDAPLTAATEVTPEKTGATSSTETAAPTAEKTNKHHRKAHS